MKCPACGADVSDAASWCTSCGQAIAPTERTAPGEPVPEALAPAATAEDERASARVVTAGGSIPPAHPEAIGKIIDGKYEIARVLGEGGMGVVYLAKDANTGVDIVLKAVRPELAHRADIRERTLAEGRALAQIDHPNVVHLNAVVSDGKSLWLVMQHIDGESLDKTVKRLRAEGKYMPFGDAVALFRQIVLGVGAAHREGVIHRDIKPGNVLVRRKDGVAKVTDFGIAKPEELARQGKGNTKGVIGSLWYMSPEQVSGQRDVDKRVDIYALGVLFYELLTNHVPFDADSSYELMRKHVEDPFPSVRTARPDVPLWVDQVLQRACAKKRDARYASCDELLADVDRLSRASIPQPVVDTTANQPRFATHDGAAVTAPGDPPRKRSSAAAWLTGIVVLLGLVGIAFGVYAFMQPPPAQHKHTPRPAGSEKASATPVASVSAAASATATASATSAPRDPLEILVGSWRSENGRDFDAVRVGGAIEFRIRDAKQFDSADYRDGETRFTLTPAPDGTYGVEDKIRPAPPVGATFDERSRNSCQELWTEVQGKPLRATFDGTRLSVDFAKIAPTAENFEQAEKVVVACKNLRNVPASRIETVLQRH